MSVIPGFSWSIPRHIDNFYSIKTAFGYVPSTRPDAPSLLRQLVYQDGLPLPGPSTDPEGWKTLRTVPVRGVMFKSRRVEARCTVSLIAVMKQTVLPTHFQMSIAQPTCYTRGSVIPCYMTLEGSESPVLDVLSAPSSIVVCLRRRVRFYNKSSSPRRDVAWNETVEDMGTAIWWPSSSARSDSLTRHLEGEIRLAKYLRPTSEMGHFSISVSLLVDDKVIFVLLTPLDQYAVVLCPFEAANYTSEASVLLSEQVEIATMYAKGPRPHAYSPPAYDPIPRRNDEFHAPLALNSFIHI